MQYCINVNVCNLHTILHCSIYSARLKPIHYSNTACLEKSDQNVFLIYSIRLGLFRWNSVHRFWINLLQKWYKCFEPHVTNVIALDCETWNAHKFRVTIELLQEGIPEFIPPHLWPSNVEDLNSDVASKHVLYTFSCTISHMLLSTGFKSGKVGAHIEVG